ncbi:hypothetical protein J7T55_000390 [Diaporthe amygdali]|uniref:uncharacterized protein n=1 Tax=Phomopsis amygdali TaxID=1214568 RepID=UPI0022FF0A24|nr:uncharacterized protein J7T55_000390 [Diaporthe amygdali]KAJ0109465.1 hypothetical protein J7T55_000390 [Diaporthe amygdali]
MAPGLFERIQSKIDIWRLEQRYTRRRHRRSTFVSNAIYVDGEYIYQTPNATGSSNNSNTSSAYDSATPSPTHAQTFSPAATAEATAPSKAERKKLNRFSSMPGFGSMSKRDSIIAPPPADWRTQRASFDGAR